MFKLECIYPSDVREALADSYEYYVGLGAELKELSGVLPRTGETLTPDDREGVERQVKLVCTYAKTVSARAMTCFEYLDNAYVAQQREAAAEWATEAE